MVKAVIQIVMVSVIFCVMPRNPYAWALSKTHYFITLKHTQHCTITELCTLDVALLVNLLASY